MTEPEKFETSVEGINNCINNNANKKIFVREMPSCGLSIQTIRFDKNPNLEKKASNCKYFNGQRTTTNEKNPDYGYFGCEYGED